MAIPILKSSNLDRTLAFLQGTLAAELLWRTEPAGDPGYAAVRWRGHELHLSSHRLDSAFGAAVYFYVDDVDEVFASLLSTGWKPPTDGGPVHAGPTDQTWEMRELYVRDPDGNSLRFGAPIKASR